MNDPFPAPERGRSRPPRISLPVALGGFVAATIIALILVGLILLSDDGQAPAAPGDASSLGAGASGTSVASLALAPTVSSAPSSPLAEPPNSPEASTPPAAALATFPMAGYPAEVLMAPGPDDGLYVLIPDQGGAVVALVAADGRVRAGWPQRLDVPWCSQVLVAPDGSARLICDARTQDEGLEPPVARIYAIGPAGRLLAGWPVDVEGGEGADMIGDEIEMIVRPYGGDAPPEGAIDPAVLAFVGPRGGRARVGTSEIAVPCCSTSLTPGPGAGYVTSRAGESQNATSNVSIFELSGPGWTLPLDGTASDPAFDHHGNAHLVVVPTTGGSSRTIVLDRSGRVVPGGSDELAIIPTNGWSGAGSEYPMAPTVDGDGRVYLVDARAGTKILGLDPTGLPMHGWPYESRLGPAQHGTCGQEDTGCGTTTVKPQVATGGALYAALAPGSSNPSGSLIALGRDGRMIDGWPVGLKGAGSEFWAIAAASGGGLWALAAEPERTGYSGTLLSIAPDSTVRGRLTIIQP